MQANMSTSMMYQNSPPAGYKEVWFKFIIENVGEAEVVTQLTPANVGLPVGTSYILKDIETCFDGTPMKDAYFELNTAPTSVAATNIGSRWFQTLSALHWDGNTNGMINAELSEGPYLLASAGVGSVAGTMRITLHIYFQ